jgi:hypothetical protein
MTLRHACGRSTFSSTIAADLLLSTRVGYLLLSARDYRLDDLDSCITCGIIEVSTVNLHASTIAEERHGWEDEERID